MLAPLTPDTPTAVLVVARPPGSAAFDDNDLTRITAFAENAALALHLAQTERHRPHRVRAAIPAPGPEDIPTVLAHYWAQLGLPFDPPPPTTPRPPAPSPPSPAETSDSSNDS